MGRHGALFEPCRGRRVTGVTLSQEQLKIARERAAAAGVSDQVKFELIDYRQVEGRFDRIVSIGMFEHVGAAHYDEFFAKCRELLEPDGVMLLHTIGKLGGATAPDPFTDKYIFPGYHLPSLCADVGGEREAAADRQRRRDPAAALRLHLAPLARARSQGAGRRSSRCTTSASSACGNSISPAASSSSKAARLQLPGTIFRDRRALPITRDYMAEAEARYRKIAAEIAPAKRAPERRSTAKRAGGSP